DKYYSDLDADGTLVIDEDLVPNAPDFPHTIRIPITRLAVEKIGKPLFANIVALGALVKITGLVQLETIQASVARRVPPSTVEKNMQALQVGWNAASK
ncbi:MAG: 2-oxoacid:acceptor oxidoreductase family protein, partial [Selenomonadaceae bacterium]